MTFVRRSTPKVPLARVRVAFERLLALPPGRREAVARARHARAPALLRELLVLLPHADTSSGFLARPSTRRLRPDTAEKLGAVPGRILGKRWRLVREIGRGGEGVVFEALDRITQTRVAVKLLRRSRGRDENRVRREVAMLRWLRLPGVVEILDDGVDGDVVWIATEYLEGSAFPGPGTERRWDAVEPIALGLLEAVGRVHAAGVVHGDLKPSNVLVDESGYVVLVDLGLGVARADRFTRPVEYGGGTPGYVAPECVRGDPPTVRSDLFAIGVMLHEALVARGRRGVERRDCGALAAPGRVRRVIACLLARRPDRRPESAAEVLRQLRERPQIARTHAWTSRELRTRFRGPDRFLHLREDAARALRRRTGGDPVAVESEVTSWLRAGLARLEGDLVVVDRSALDRIASLPRQRRGANSVLARALLTGTSRAVVRGALRQGEIEFDAGRAARALAAFEEGAAAARSIGDVAALREFARRAVGAAVNSAVGRDIDRALWLIQRGGEVDRELAALAEVARAAAEQQRGRSESAWRIAMRITRRGPQRALRLAWSVREMAARALGPRHRAAVLQESARWVKSERTEEARTAHRTWKAWNLYFDGRCAEALRLHLQGLETERNPSLRTRMAIDAAGAALDSGKPDVAVNYARSAMAAARRLRRPIQEARAWSILRDARYRRGDRMRLDLDAIDAVGALGYQALADAVRITEAAIAWRVGEHAIARSILRSIVASVDPDTASIIQLVAVSLDVASGAPISPARRHAVGDRAMQTAAPGLAMQILALLEYGRPRRRSRLPGTPHLPGLPSSSREWRRRREVLTLDEAAAILGICAPR